MHKKNLLIINCGSSSLKFTVIDKDSEVTLLAGLAQRLANKDPRANISWSLNGQKGEQQLPKAGHQEAVKALIGLLVAHDLHDGMLAVGHRVVHGGDLFTQPCLLDDKVLADIKACIPLAPLHNPAAIIGIQALQKYFAHLPMSCVFDTSFHQTMPEKAYLYPLPYAYYQDKKIRRYGAHGISYQFICEKFAQKIALPLEDSALLVAHLGNGCSATAILHGKSVDTTMGLTPLEGLMMGTRSGNVDPNVFYYLKDKYGFSLEDTIELLNKKSGFLGVSGLSNDCRTVEQAAAEGHKQAQIALELFAYILAKHLGALAMSMGRVDGLAFTGGIGENSATIRAKVVNQLALLGFHLDDIANAQMIKSKEGPISMRSSKPIWVLGTNEELVIARETVALF